MDARQRIELRMSTLRRTVNEQLGSDIETRSESYESDLAKSTNELRSLETELQAAIVAAGPEPLTRHDAPEDRELRSMLSRSNLGNIFESALERRSIDGVERELQQHYGLGGNAVPLALLRLETRAVTPAPANVGQDQQPIVPMVFPQSVASFLDVDMPTVGVGEHVFPVLTAGASAQTPAENTATSPTEDTGSFSADVLSPARLQTAFFYSREDRARFAGMDAALRENLSDALADGLDKAIVGNLLTGTNLANNTQAAETTFANYLSQFAYGRVDGKYATSTNDLRIVMGSDTYAHCGTAYRHQNADDLALDRLVALTGGVRVSAHVTDTSANKQNAIIRLGMRRDMVAPIWEGVTIVADDLTKADEGQIKITAGFDARDQDPPS